MRKLRLTPNQALHVTSNNIIKIANVCIIYMGLNQTRPNNVLLTSDMQGMIWGEPELRFALQWAAVAWLISSVDSEATLSHRWTLTCCSPACLSCDDSTFKRSHLWRKLACHWSADSALSLLSLCCKYNCLCLAAPLTLLLLLLFFEKYTPT